MSDTVLNVLILTTTLQGGIAIINIQFVHEQMEAPGRSVIRQCTRLQEGPSSPLGSAAWGLGGSSAGG